MVIKQKLEKIKSGELSAEDNIKQFLDKIKAEDEKINSFIHVNENALEEAKAVDKKEKKGKLAGLAIAVKSCISVTDLPTTCAAKTLEDYKGTFDADVIEKIKAEDGIIIGMTNMDCFACGVSGESSMFGNTDNPKAPGHIPGGSSSGSAAAVAADFCDIALGTDTGGSIRNPASHCGIVGVKPSYGRVSRYGLVDMSMSLDQIGPLCKDVYGCALMMEIISGKSDYDGITFDKAVKDYSNFKEAKGLKIGISKDFEKLCTDERVQKLINEQIEKLAKATGSETKEISLKYVDLAIQAYYPIVYVEVFSGTRKFEGRKYGKKIEESCSEEVLRRILGGKEISKAEHDGAYYKKALLTKKLITQDFNKAFEDVDVILTPVVPRLPHKFGEKLSVNEMYAYDAFTSPANLAGICGASVPAGTIDNIPVGVQVLAPAFKEDVLFNVMNSLEE